MNPTRQCLSTSFRRIPFQQPIYAPKRCKSPPKSRHLHIPNAPKTLLRQSPFHQLVAKHLPRRPAPPVRHTHIRRHNSGKPHFNPTPHLGSPEPSPSLSQRLRKLTREYGWSAVGVYLALSALDLPFCYLAVRWVGPETVGRWESIILGQLRKVSEVLPFGLSSSNRQRQAESIGGGTEEDGAVDSGKDSNVDEVEHATEVRHEGDQASLWTQLALAYAIHKSLLVFIRVPLTAALTPKVVKVLRGWGYDIGKRKPKVVESGPK